MRKWLVVFLISGLLLGCFSSAYADNGTDFQVQDDLTVLGEGGSLNDADVEVEGRSVFQKQLHINTEGLSSPFGGLGRGENLLLYSEELDNASWTALLLTVTANDTTVLAPDGSASAEVLTNSGGVGSLSQTVSASASTQYVFSIWLRAGTSTSAQIKLEDNGTTPASNAYDITLTSKWKRYEVVLTTSADATQVTATITNTGADLTTIYAWGGQLERSDHARVYVKTSSQAVSQTNGGFVNNDLRIGPGSFDNASASADLYVTGNLEVDGSTWLGDEATVDKLTVTGTMNFTGNLNLEGSLKVGDGTVDNLDMSNLSGQQDLYVTDGLEVDGNVFLGDAAGDSITINASTLSVPNNLNIDSNTLYIDAANNRVGVGTSSPSGLLDVHGIMFQTGIGSSVVIRTDAGVGALGLGESVFIGHDCGPSALVGMYNTAVGATAMHLLAGGVQNTALGYGALYSNGGDGDNNVAVGYNSLSAVKPGDYNVAIGSKSMLGVNSNTVGETTGNTGAGGYSLYSIDGGTYNVGIGYSALGALTTGSGNIGIGAGAGTSVTLGSYNILIGADLPGSEQDSQLNIGNVIRGRVHTSMKVIYCDGTTCYDHSTESQTTDSGDYPVLGDTDDIFYVGRGYKFNQLYLYLSQAATNAPGIVIEYYDSSTDSWEQLTTVDNNLSDGTVNLSTSGLISFNAPSDWGKTSVNGSLMYWIRLRSPTISPNPPVRAYLTVASGLNRLEVYSNEGDSTPALVVDAHKHVGVNASSPEVGLQVGTGTIDNVSDTDDGYIAGDLEVDGTIYGTVSGTLNPGFTQGSIPFADGTGGLTEDNANLYWDDTNDRLGIGTNTPQASLDIFGTTSKLRLSYDLSNYSELYTEGGGQLVIKNSGWSTSGAIYLYKGSYNLKTRVHNSGKVTLTAFKDGGDYLPIYFEVKEFHVLTGSYGTGLIQNLTVTQGGDVGVGTASPSAKLDVYGQNNATANNDPDSTSLTSTFNLFSALQSVDNDTATKAWDTTGNLVGDYLQIDLGAGNEKDYVKVGLYLSQSGYDGIYDIQYSDNGTTWATAKSGFAPNLKGWNWISWDNVGAHQYWRLVLSTASSAVNGDIMEMAWQEAVDSSVMLVDGSGKVGVQTTPSKSAFEVKDVGIDTASTTDIDATTAILDEVKVDDYNTVTWKLIIKKGANRRVSFVNAVHDGTDSSDATTVTYTEYGIVSVGSFTTEPVVSVDLSGTGADQVMRLKVSTSDVDVEAKAYRIAL